MKLSTKSRYGTRILVELGNHHGTGLPLQVSQIARLQDIPMKYLEQLLRRLRLAGIVRSVRGPKGGHILNVAPEAISLGQVVRLFEAQEELVECIGSPATCVKAADCHFRQAWKNATEALYANLDEVKISDLMALHGSSD
jgi:Rrf2 family protein